MKLKKSYTIEIEITKKEFETERWTPKVAKIVELADELDLEIALTTTIIE